MKTIERIEILRSEIAALKASGKSIGFVPTMGALHEGHLSLVRRSKSENDVTVVSIFVNPTQFNDKKDFENYPSTFVQDQSLLRAEKTEFLFYPDYDELYADSYRYKISENELSNKLCGAHRPGHFDGVLTVVMKLLNLVEADHAYFGEKDFQQLQLIKGMVEAFFIKTEIVSCKTIRESDGLAMSSRNRVLNGEARIKAKEFPKILALKNISTVQKIEMLKKLEFEVDYIEDLSGRRFGAVKIGGVRLIDNIKFSDSQEVVLEAPNTL